MPQVVIPDMTIAARAGQEMPPPANLLTMGQQAMDLQGAQLRNQEMRNNLTAFQANQAAGQDFQKSINPLTGQMDQQALNRNLATDPQAALAAQNSSQQGLQNLEAQLQSKGMTLDQAVKRISYASNSLGSMLSNPNSITKSSVISALGDGVSDGVYSAKDAAALVPTIPDDPQGAQAWVKQHYASAQQSINGIMPHLMQREDGQYTWLANTNAAAGNLGTPVNGTAVHQQLTPGQAAQPVTLPSASGAAQVTSLGQFNQAANGGGAPNIVATGSTTQQQAANEVAGHAQGQQAATYVNDTANLAQTRAALQGISVELPTANGGPLSEALRNVGGALGELGISGMDQASAYDLMQKGSAQVVVSKVADGLGVPTDMKMQAIASQTPGTHMTGPAAAVAVGQIQGLLDYQLARSKAAQEAGVIGNPANSSQFNLQWQQRFPNASVFQFPHLPQAYQQKYWNAMPATQRKAFYGQLQNAVSSGYVDPSQIKLGK